MTFFVKEARKSKNMTIRELAFRSGVAVSNIQKIENNVADPRISTICKLAKALEVPLENLVDCG